MPILKYYNEQTNQWEKVTSNGAPGSSGKSAYAYAQEAGFTGTEEEFAEKLVNTGVSSWNDLTDKPFGDVVVTFDGNLDGKTCVTFYSGAYLVKVSDKVLSEAECVGANMAVSFYGNEITVTAVGTQDCTSQMGFSCFIPVYDNFSGMPYLLVVREFGTFEEQEVSSGTYFLYMEDDGLVYTKSFDALKQAKTIAPQYLPDYLPSIETIDPVFNGDPTVRESIYLGPDYNDAYAVKVTPQSVSVEELIGSTIVLNVEGVEQKAVIDENDAMDADYSFGVPGAMVLSMKQEVLVISFPENVNIQGVSLSAGTWFMCIPGSFYVKSLSCLVATETVHKLPEKFLPDYLPKVETVIGEKLISTTCQTKSLASYGGAFGVNIPFANTLTAIPEGVTVILDGWEYKDLAVITTPLGCIAGNLSKVNALQGTSFEDTGEPFMLGIDEYGCLLATDMTQSTTHNIIVKIPDEEVIHKLDNKFIDAEWMATITKGAMPFDGNITGKESVYLYDIGTYPIYLVKITDTSFPVETIVGSNITIAIGEEEVTDAVTADTVSSPFGELSAVVGSLDDLNVISLGQDVTYNGITISKGTWFKCAVGEGGMYIKWLSCISTEDIVHKIPEKFLPESVALKNDIPITFYVTVTGANGNYTADKTFAEISAAYQDNKNIYCKLSCVESDFDTGDGHMVVPLININDTDVCFTTIQYDMSIFICIADSGETTFEYMFIPENNYTHPATHPASMITGLATVATSGKYSDLSGRPTIPTVPTALKNPNPLTVNGTVYDGSETKEVFIPHVSNIQNAELDGETCVEITFEQSEDVTKIQYIPYAPSALPNPNALTINGTTYDGSQAVTIDASTLYVSITLTSDGTAYMSHTVADIEEAYQNNRTIICNYGSVATTLNHFLHLVRRVSSTQWDFGGHLIIDDYYIRVRINGTNVTETLLNVAKAADIPTDSHINDLISAQLSAITNAEEVAF